MTVKETMKEGGREEEREEVTFASLGLVQSLCKTCEELGYKNPTPIQKEAIPFALKGRDLIGLAQTGSGKTAAFVLPILQALLERPQPLFAELAIQISEQFEALGADIGVRCAVIVGGVEMMAQAVALARRPHVVVGTPGRLVDHLENTRGFSLRTLRYLVLDEADRLLNMDFGPEIDKILRVIPTERHTFLFSATMTSKVEKLQRASLVDPVRVEVSSKHATVDSLLQYYVFLPAKLKDCYLLFLLNELAGNTAIIFASTCQAVQRIAIMLRLLGFAAVPLHGQMPQPKRLAALNKFKASECSLLIATDVASRGLDIPQVDCVINYDIPPHPKDYIHRVGRTARAGRSGKSISLVTQYDVELYQRIEQFIGKKLPVFDLDKEAVGILQERVQEAHRLAMQQLREEQPSKGSRKRSKNKDDDERIEYAE